MKATAILPKSRGVARREAGTAEKERGDRRISRRGGRRAQGVSRPIRRHGADDPRRQEPGHESQLEPKPDWQPRYPGSGRLNDKVALVTGADSGIGRAVGALFAREGADVAILYLCEHDDAAKTKDIVEKEGRRAITIAGDIGDKSFCETRGQGNRRQARAARRAGQQCRRAASRQGHSRHHRGAAEADLPDQHFRHVLHDPGGAPHLKQGSAIINCTSRPPTRARPSCSTIARPRARSWASPARSRSTSSTRAFA